MLVGMLAIFLVLDVQNSEEKCPLPKEGISYSSPSGPKQGSGFCVPSSGTISCTCVRAGVERAVLDLGELPDKIHFLPGHWSVQYSYTC